MPSTREVTREISYAHSARTRGGRAVIRAVENTTGRIRLIRRARGYEHDVAQGRDFWDVMVERYGLSLEVVAGSLEMVPEKGPLVLVANHPYGILDGLIMGLVLSKRRGRDFRVIANGVFRKAQDLDDVILPISFDEGRDAKALNLATRRRAIDYLGDGGAIGIFPGGTVATASRPFGQPMDPLWRTFTAKLIAKSDATVVPIYFDGQNSRLFQLASHLHLTLRMALLIKEFRKRIDSPVRLAIGRPIDREQIDALAGQPREMMDFLRAETYALAPKPPKSLAYGYDFEQRNKS